MLADPYDTQKLNRYAYVRNNPVKYTDPSGNFLLPSIAIAGLIALDYGITAYDAYRANSVINNPSSTVEQRTQAQMDLANTLAFEQADIGWAAGAVLPTDDIARKVLGSGIVDNIGNKTSKVASQIHHMIPWKNNEFNHQSHGLIREAGINLKNYSNNLLELVNHKGRHSKQYNEEVSNLLDNYYNKLHKGEYSDPKDALNDALQQIEYGINTGDLKLYKSKEVWIPNE